MTPIEQAGKGVNAVRHMGMGRAVRFGLPWVLLCWIGGVVLAPCVSESTGRRVDYPEVRDLRLLDPDTSCFRGQVFWLNAKGADDVTYRGPKTIRGIRVPAFKAPEPFRGHEEDILELVAQT